MEDHIAIRSAALSDEAALADIAAVVQQLHYLERPDVFKSVNTAELKVWFRAALEDGEPYLSGN